MPRALRSSTNLHTTVSLKRFTFTRLDIVFAVQQICLFMYDPREPHMHALKCILRYIRGTLDHILQLHVSSSSYLVAYSDVDWGRCLVFPRCTSSYCVFLGDNIISKSSKCQGGYLSVQWWGWVPWCSQHTNRNMLSSKPSSRASVPTNQSHYCLLWQHQVCQHVLELGSTSMNQAYRDWHSLCLWSGGSRFGLCFPWFVFRSVHCIFTKGMLHISSMNSRPVWTSITILPIKL